MSKANTNRPSNPLDRFVPIELLHKLEPDDLSAVDRSGSLKAPVSILFSDVRGFSALSEMVSNEELLAILNRIFENICPPIYQHHGFVDKFVGDAVMAIFGLDHTKADDAVQAAVDMQLAMVGFNESMVRQGHTLEIGVGIHTGDVVIGTVGYDNRLSTTVLGDNVNLASRIEGLTKFYGAHILISSDTLADIENRKAFRYREIDWLRVKGKSQPVVIYEVCNADDDQVWKAKKNSGKLIKRGLVSRHLRDWYAAISCFTKAIEEYPDDKAAKFHVDQVYRLMHKPPSANWDGAIELEHK